MLEQAINEHGKIFILVELEELSGIEARAILDEFAFDVHHFRAFDRLAVVGDDSW